jgi:hypothetical protein
MTTEISAGARESQKAPATLRTARAIGSASTTATCRRCDHLHSSGGPADIRLSRELLEERLWPSQWRWP